MSLDLETFRYALELAKKDKMPGLLEKRSENDQSITRTLDKCKTHDLVYVRKYILCSFGIQSGNMVFAQLNCQHPAVLLWKAL